METLKKLSSSELHKINGGESFAYRVGQAVALLTYKATGIPSYGAIKAEMDWFG